MPDTGSPYNLRYPVLADAPNVPADIKNLADDSHASLAAVAALLNADFIRRVGTNSSNVPTTSIAGTEVSMQAAGATLVTGRRYLIRWIGRLQQSLGTDVFVIRLREDSVAGTQLMIAVVTVDTSPTGKLHILEAEYTAVADGAKTFFATAIRSAGSNTLTSHAAANAPKRLTIDQVAG
jgi:hypothetical protein